MLLSPIRPFVSCSSPRLQIEGTRPQQGQKWIQILYGPPSPRCSSVTVTSLQAQGRCMQAQALSTSQPLHCDSVQGRPLGAPTKYRLSSLWELPLQSSAHPSVQTQGSHSPPDPAPGEGQLSPPCLHGSSTIKAQGGDSHAWHTLTAGDR